MAGKMGVEPTTFGLEDRCSIHRATAPTRRNMLSSSLYGKQNVRVFTRSNKWYNFFAKEF